jgi:hypothetical protein
MKHSFNYTGRKTLSHRGASPEVGFTLYADEQKDKYEFSALIDLSGRKELPSQAAVILEVQYRTQYERYDWGTVSSHKDIAYRQPITSIRTDAAEFTIKIVDEHGKILAQAKRISPQVIYEHVNDNGSVEQTADQQSESSSLLAIKAIDMSQLWRVELRMDRRPLLQVNKKYRIKELLHDSAALRAAIFPAALREIALRYLVMKDSRDDKWAETFLRFAQMYNEQPLPQKYEDNLYEARTQQWIEDFIQAYCARMKITDGIETEQAGDK